MTDARCLGVTLYDGVSGRCQPFPLSEALACTIGEATSFTAGSHRIGPSFFRSPPLPYRAFSAAVSPGWDDSHWGAGGARAGPSIRQSVHGGTAAGGGVRPPSAGPPSPPPAPSSPPPPRPRLHHRPVAHALVSEAEAPVEPRVDPFHRVAPAMVPGSTPPACPGRTRCAPEATPASPTAAAAPRRGPAACNSRRQGRRRPPAHSEPRNIRAASTAGALVAHARRLLDQRPVHQVRRPVHGAAACWTGVSNRLRSGMRWRC